MRSLVNFSDETYITRIDLFSATWPIACSRCVLPSPTPPYTTSGLYACAGLLATAWAAACARRLLLPTINVLNVCFGFSVGGGGAGRPSSSSLSGRDLVG